MDGKNSESYFETQSLRRCGLHAVNNILGKQAYTAKDFHKMAEELKMISKQNHESMFTIGNYDYNLIEMALKNKGLIIQWHPAKQKEIKLEELLNDQLFGILLNIQKEQGILEKLCSWEPNHWVASKRAGKLFLLFDSKQQAPQQFVFDQFIIYLNELKQNINNHILLILQLK